MSIFDTRKSATAAIRNESGDVAVSLPEHGTEDYPWTGFDGPFDMADQSDEGWGVAGTITATAEYVRSDDTHNGDSWAHHVFRVRMRFEGRQMSTTYRVGTGWEQAPSVQDVLADMFSDYEHTRYEDIDAMGYEEERARQIERAVERQTERLMRFLG